MWWPLPVLAVGGLVVALSLRYLPGSGGHNPAEGFRTGGNFTAGDLPGIVVASFATLAFGAVLGPEAPLVLIGSLIAVIMVRLVRRDAPEPAVLLVGAAGSFAAISSAPGRGHPQASCSGGSGLQSSTTATASSTTSSSAQWRRNSRMT